MITALCILAMFSNTAYASEGNITISVTASDNESEGLTYALDSEDPEAFGNSNKFVVPAGSAHTIYVKDAAGNITSQQYLPNHSSTTATASASNSQIEIEVEINPEEGVTSNSNYEYLTDTPMPEKGNGTLYSQAELNGSDKDSKVFYTITTKDGNVFYMLIDKSSSTENVYLLDQVTESDLLSMTGGAAAIADETNDSLLSQLSGSGNNDEIIQSADVPKDTKSPVSSSLMILLLIGVAGVIYYYFKVYKKKKETEMDLYDAKDMDEFEAEEEDEGEEVFFNTDISEEEKQDYLNNLIASDDIEDEEREYLDMDPAEIDFDNEKASELEDEYDDEFDGEED